MSELQFEDAFLDEKTLEMGVDNLASVSDLSEASISEFSNIILLDKSAVQRFVHVVEPYTEQALDDYGKSIRFSCKSDAVELCFVNDAVKLKTEVQNKANSVVADFVIGVPLIKRILNLSLSTVAFVEKDGKIHITICGELLEINTIPLDLTKFDVPPVECANDFSSEDFSRSLRIIQKVFFTTDKASERVALFSKDGINLLTSVFFARLVNPFNGEFVLQKVDINSLVNLFSAVKDNSKYQISDNILHVSCSGIEMSINLIAGSQLDSFKNPVYELAFKEESSLIFVNDIVNDLLKVALNFEYLSNLVTLEFNSDELNIILKNDSQQEKARYTLKYLEGSVSDKFNIVVDSKAAVGLFSILGSDTKYAITSYGLQVQSGSTKLIFRTR